MIYTTAAVGRGSGRPALIITFAEYLTTVNLQE